MRLTRLALQNFRCYALARIALPPGPVAFVGENGGGKTSLLEAAYALATGKSFRAATLSRLIRAGAPEAAVLGEWLADEKQKPRERELRIPLAGGGRGVQFFLRGKPVPRGAIPEFLPVVAFCREFLAILSGPPEGRRRFLDRGLIAADNRYLEFSAEVRRALRQKQAALVVDDTRTLRALQETLAPRVFRMQRARLRFVDKLSRALPLLAEELAVEGGEIPPLTLRYRPSPGAAAVEALAAGDLAAWKPHFVAALAGERKRQMILSGPQRDELEILWDGRPVAQASGGQQRLALYLLKRAKVEVLARQFKTPPLFLLDDADAEWDDLRLGAVLASLARAPGQLLLTAKRREVVELLPVPPTVFTVKAGKVTR